MGQTTTKDHHPMQQQEQLLSPVDTLELKHIHPALERRRQIDSLRQLTPYPIHQPLTINGSTSFVEFSSNDYLGLAQSIEQQRKVDETYQTLRYNCKHLGSTGSRLLTGDSLYVQDLEQQLATIHQKPAALICNSGYDANLAVMSCLISHGVTLVLDELCHNSIQMGVRMGRTSNNTRRKEGNVRTFRHNNLIELERLLLQQQDASNNEEVAKVKTRTPSIVIVVESIYSMDGDAAPLKDIFDLAFRYHACIVVDEAHGLGVYGKRGLGVLEEFELQLHPALLCTIHTFGKAAGCHGAVVSASKAFIQFLYNYGRPIVYSTSLPMHSLVSISCSYDTMMGPVGKVLRKQVHYLVQVFRELVLQKVIQQCKHNSGIVLLESNSPIQALVVPGNLRCVTFCQLIQRKSNDAILLFPIRSPTVPKGEERVRVVLHAHNTLQEVENLVTLIQLTLIDMQAIWEESTNLSHGIIVGSRL